MTILAIETSCDDTCAAVVTMVVNGVLCDGGESRRRRIRKSRVA